MVSLQRVWPAAVSVVLKQGPLTAGKLRFAWRAAVGPALDRVSQVELGPDQTLIATVDDPRWRTEIARSKELIRARLAALIGPEAIRTITIRATQGPRSS